MTINLWEIARKQLQKSRATPQDHTCKVLSAAYTFPRSLANSLAYKLYRALCLSLINNISVKTRNGMQKKGSFFVYDPSPVKSQKFLPAVNHTKLRIPMLSMFTTELMEKSTCTLVWKTKVGKLGLLFFPWVWMVFQKWHKIFLALPRAVARFFVTGGIIASAEGTSLVGGSEVILLQKIFKLGGSKMLFSALVMRYVSEK